MTYQPIDSSLGRFRLYNGNSNKKATLNQEGKVPYTTGGSGTRGLKRGKKLIYGLLYEKYWNIYMCLSVLEYSLTLLSFYNVDIQPHFHTSYLQTPESKF